MNWIYNVKGKKKKKNQRNKKEFLAIDINWDEEDVGRAGLGVSHFDLGNIECKVPLGGDPLRTTHEERLNIYVDNGFVKLDNSRQLEMGF